MVFSSIRFPFINTWAVALMGSVGFCPISSGRFIYLPSVMGAFISSKFSALFCPPKPKVWGVAVSLETDGGMEFCFLLSALIVMYPSPLRLSTFTCATIWPAAA